jgi:hypothetical protein
MAAFQDNLNWREQAAEQKVQASGALHFGSWTLNVFAAARADLDTLGSLVRQNIAEQPRAPQPDADLYLARARLGSEYFPRGAGADVGTHARWEWLGDDVRMLYTGWLRTFVESASTPTRMAIFIREPQYSARAFRDHLFEILCKLLFLHERFYLHAAAVEFAAHVNLFVARGSNGKTTLALKLAQAGGTILSEDHVVIRRAPSGEYWVSGCQDTMRVTAKTEQLLPTALDLPAVDGIGGPKKEFRTATFFRAAPFQDFPFRRIFFNHLGARYHLTPLSRQAAQLRFIYMTRSFFRPDDADDMARYLDFWRGVTQARDCFDLELSPDLAALDALAHFLRAA